MVDEALIPALDIVGAKYEKGTLFLPQLLQDLAVGDAQFLQIPGAAHGHQLQKPQLDGEIPDIPPDEPAVVLRIIAPQRHIVELERDAAEHGILKSLLQRIPLIATRKKPQLQFCHLPFHFNLVILL